MSSLTLRPRPSSPAHLLVELVAVSLLASGCGGPGPAPADVDLPPTGGVFDYQLGGSYDQVSDPGGTSRQIDVVVRPVADGPLAGAYSICYVNGFQTQPDEAERWQGREDLLLHDDAGELVVDPDWPDEYVLDPSNRQQRHGILELIGADIDQCAQAGFNAIEIDNVDTAHRFEAIDPAGSRALAGDYVEQAHGLGLAVGQKNAADDVCANDQRPPMTIIRDRDLVAPGEPGHVYRACD